jgi:hypothetical protein
MHMGAFSTRTHLLLPPPLATLESHLGVRTSYATWRKRKYEANKCG